MNAKTPNKRERRAAQLLAHYATCERLAIALGMPAANVDGKKISVALLKIERDANNAATAQCNGADYNGQPFRKTWDDVTGDELDENPWEAFKRSIAERVALAFGRSPRPENAPPAFFVNGDARGYALKIDNEKPEGKALIEAVKLHTDWGGFGILSPEITGD